MDSKNPPTHNTFEQNLHAQLEKHLSDSSLTIGKLLRYLGMSRTDLHRKLKRAKGMSASRYLMHIRLLRAAVLIVEQPEWSLSQIACEVGIKSQSYFTIKFKAQFGVCPLAFRKASMEENGDLEHL